MIAIIIALATLLLLTNYYWFSKSSKRSASENASVADINARLENHISQLTPLDVRVFYNENTDRFLNVYGNIIQAYRTHNVDDYLDYTIKSAGLQDGQIILDAGCGVGGPAIYFASKLNVEIKGCTISDVQHTYAQRNIAERGVQDKVSIIKADYHTIDEVFPHNHFDRVIFLESFGHSPDKAGLILAAWNVLKPGGYLYIKDLFEREAGGHEDVKRIKEICLEINQAYQYAIADLHEVISCIRKKGFILNFVKTPEIDISIFEHLTISNQFQDLFDIGKISSWENYVFPIDFYEIKCQKPPFMIEKDKHLYHMNKSEVSA
jgi:ubiquinone/menaquinone biosynthesis C-methylase UbiE